jgi:hypothetical protein
MPQDLLLRDQWRTRHFCASFQDNIIFCRKTNRLTTGLYCGQMHAKVFAGCDLAENRPEYWDLS